MDIQSPADKIIEFFEEFRTLGRDNWRKELRIMIDESFQKLHDHLQVENLESMNEQLSSFQRRFYDCMNFLFDSLISGINNENTSPLNFNEVRRDEFLLVESTNLLRQYDPTEDIFLKAKISEATEVREVPILFPSEFVGAWNSASESKSKSSFLVSQQEKRSKDWVVCIFSFNDGACPSKIHLNRKEIIEEYRNKSFPRLFMIEGKNKALFYLRDSKYACCLEFDGDTQIFKKDFTIHNIHLNQNQKNAMMAYSLTHNLMVIFQSDKISVFDLDSFQIIKDFPTLYAIRNVCNGTFYDEDRLLFGNPQNIYCYDFLIKKLFNVKKDVENQRYHESAIICNRYQNQMIMGGEYGKLTFYSINFDDEKFATLKFMIGLPQEEIIYKIFLIDQQNILVWQENLHHLSFVNIETKGISKKDIPNLDKELGICDVTFLFNKDCQFLINDGLKRRILYRKVEEV